MIEVHLLRYALAAADSGSFSRAADEFRVKQSTLSKHIRYLETRLGIPIFTRTTQGVAPTAGGLRFLARARSIVTDLESLSSESAAIARGDEGRLRIGFHCTLAAGNLRATLEAFRREAPDVELDATEGGRQQLLQALDRDRLDLAIVAGDTKDMRRRSLSLWSEPLAIGLPNGHPLLERERLYWTDLQAMGFLVTRADPGDLIASMIAARLSGPGRAPRVVAQSVSCDNLHSLATSELLSVTAGVARVEGSDIAFREVHDAFGVTRLSQSLVWSANSSNPALGRFLALAAHRHGRSLAEV